MQVISLVLSVVSLIVSIIVGVYDKKVDKKLNNISIASTYFNDLYKDLLLNKIPQNRKKITITANGKLVGSDDLIQTLKDIRSNSLYFFYTDVTFYNNLKTKLQDLENYILASEDEELFGEEQTTVLNQISDKIADVYKVMTEKCLKG
ncbi:MAG: hypothetical protein IJN22_06615 [Clostridia bacterium]|nr:hypothetical protein [Clostridia bacterium]